MDICEVIDGDVFAVILISSNVQTPNILFKITSYARTILTRSQVVTHFLLISSNAEHPKDMNN